MQKNRTDPLAIYYLLRIYRLLLAFYPKPFRNEYALLMAQAFRDCSLSTFHAGGLAGMLALWVFTFLDFVKTMVNEHLQKEAIMPRNTFVRLSGWALILGALSFTPFLLLESAGIGYNTILEAPLGIGFFFGPILIAIGLLGLRIRYGGEIGSLGKNILLIGALGGVIVLIGDIGQEFEEDLFFTIFAVGLLIIFLCLTLFGLIALRRNPLPRGNGLPLIAGIWIPALISFALLNITQIGTGQTNWFFSLAILITTIALVLLGYTLQSDANQEELAPLQA